MSASRVAPGAESGQATARLCVVGAAVLFSVGGAAIKASPFTSWQVASFRSASAAVTLVALVPAARAPWSWRAVVVAVAYASTMILFVTSTKLTTAANAIFLQSTAPLYLVLIGPWLLHEPVRQRDVPFMAALLVGLAAIVGGARTTFATAPDPVRGNLVATASGVAWAFTVAGLRWLGKTGTATMPTLIAGNVFAALGSLPFALPIGASRPVDWLVVGALGTLQIALAYVLLASGVRRLPALEASLLLLLEPVLNPFWTWVVHGEAPGRAALVGGGIILAATAVRLTLSSDER